MFLLNQIELQLEKRPRKLFWARSRCTRFNILRPITCGMPNISRISRWRWCPCSLRAGGS